VGVVDAKRVEMGMGRVSTFFFWGGRGEGEGQFEGARGKEERSRKRKKNNARPYRGGGVHTFTCMYFHLPPQLKK
jgi:hypothetical protein